MNSDGHVLETLRSHTAFAPRTEGLSWAMQKRDSTRSEIGEVDGLAGSMVVLEIPGILQ
jgi:hypothetical protein